MSDAEQEDTEMTVNDNGNGNGNGKEEEEEEEEEKEEEPEKPEEETTVYDFDNKETFKAVTEDLHKLITNKNTQLWDTIVNRDAPYRPITPKELQELKFAITSHRDTRFKDPTRLACYLKQRLMQLAFPMTHDRLRKSASAKKRFQYYTSQSVIDVWMCGENFIIRLHVFNKKQAYILLKFI